MLAHFKDEVLKACDEVCGKKRGSRGNGVTRWWNEEVKEAISRKKEAHKAMCQNSTGENKRKNKAVSEAMREMVEEVLT